MEHFKTNAEEDYMHTPISVLRYISELEKRVNDAMGFAEWVSYNDWKFDVDDKWRFETNHQNYEKTTTELFEIYQQQKQQK